MAGKISSEKTSKLCFFLKFNKNEKFFVSEKERKAAAFDIIDLLYSNIYAGCDDIVKTIIKNILLVRKPNGKRIENKYLIMSVDDILSFHDNKDELILIKPEILKIIKGLEND